MPIISPQNHHSKDLVNVFSECFNISHNTILVANADEPLYIPATKNRAAEIHFRKNYYSSALHEIAHWCIAGKERRTQVDYGYWYIADGRNHKQQQAFFDAEVKPQSLEWLFSTACGYPFSISVDNIAAGEQQSNWSYWEKMEQTKLAFQRRCIAQIQLWYETRLPERGYVFLSKLAERYALGHIPTIEDITVSGCAKQHA